MRADCVSRTALRNVPLRKRPAPGIREHPGRDPLVDPDRPSLWRSPHPVLQRAGQQRSGGPFRSAGVRRGSWPVFQSTIMHHAPDPLNRETDPSQPASSRLPNGALTFASLVRHELVNPLNALSGWLHLLSIRPPVSEAIVDKALKGAHRAVGQQLQQIEMLSRLLELSEPGARLDTTAVSLAELARQCSQDARVSGPVAFNLQEPYSEGTQTVLLVRAHPQALSAVLALLLRHVAEQADAQSGVRIELASQAHEVSMTVWCVPALPESADALALPVSGASTAQTRSLEWLHALAVIRALQGHLSPVHGDVREIGLRLCLPALGLEEVR